MNISSRRLWVFITVVIAVLIMAIVYWYIEDSRSFSRGEALQVALQTIIGKQDTGKSLVADIILKNYQETRRYALLWSGIYWVCTFAAAALSAFAAVVLKLESFDQWEKQKKDVSVLLSVTATIMVTISTSGDFGRKWQANRIAAAELERIGYDYLQNDGDNPRSYLKEIGDSLLRRQLLIVGNTETQNNSGRPEITQSSQTTGQSPEGSKGKIAHQK